MTTAVPGPPGERRSRPNRAALAGLGLAGLGLAGLGLAGLGLARRGTR